MHSHVSLPSDLVFRLEIKLFLYISDISGITNDPMNEPGDQCCALERRNRPCRSFFFLFWFCAWIGSVELEIGVSGLCSGTKLEGFYMQQ